MVLFLSRIVIVPGVRLPLPRVSHRMWRAMPVGCSGLPGPSAVKAFLDHRDTLVFRRQ